MLNPTQALKLLPSLTKTLITFQRDCLIIPQAILMEYCLLGNTAEKAKFQPIREYASEIDLYRIDRLQN